MTAQHLTMIFQSYCHEGGALDEVEIYDKAGNKLFAIEDITLERHDFDEKVKVVVHPRTIQDMEEYAKERVKEKQQKWDANGISIMPFHDGAGIGINSENFGNY